MGVLCGFGVVPKGGRGPLLFFLHPVPVPDLRPVPVPDVLLRPADQCGTLEMTEQW